jgi:DNA-binding NarL/FixJ family response regulator
VTGSPESRAERQAGTGVHAEGPGATRAPGSGDSPIRLVVVDDHVAVRASLVAFLEAQDGLEVVGEAENGREAVDLADDLRPDLVLMDVRMPVMGGIEAARLIKEARPTTRVVLVTAYEQRELVESAEKAGADGLLLKGISGAELAARVKEAAA